MALDLRETRLVLNLLQMDDSPLQKVLESLKSVVKQVGAGRLCITLRALVFDDYFHTAGSSCLSEMLISAFILHSCGLQTSGNSIPAPNTRSALYQMLQFIESDKSLLQEKSADPNLIRETIALKVFIFDLLAGVGDLLAKTPKQILAGKLEDLLTRQESYMWGTVRNALEEAKKIYDAEMQNAPQSSWSSRGVSPIIVGEDKTGVDTGGTDEWQYYSKEAISHRFNALPDRPAPPPLGVLEHEMSWLYTAGYTTDLVWDTTMGQTPEEGQKLRAKIQKALRHNLPNEEEQQLKQSLLEHPEQLLRVGVTPARLSTLVDRNPHVGAFFISTLVQQDLRAAEEFLVSLINMNVCLGSCNVMSELAQIKTLPVSYLRDFVVSAIRNLKATTKADRRVAILCAMISGLLRETDPESPKVKVFNDPSFLQDITHFACQHTNVSEAITLYRLLKEYTEKKGDGATPTTPLTSTDSTPPAPK